MTLLDNPDILDIPEGAVLQQAIERFNEASVKLQEKYEELSLEVISLKDQLQQKDQEIARAAKLATLGETAAAIAHEIRNPLGALRLFLSILKQDSKEDPQTMEILQQMDKSISTMDHVVSNILQFSRDQEFDIAPVNIRCIAEEELKLAIKSNGNTIKSRVLGPELLYLQANEHGMRQVFSNLFMNACQALAGAGTISLTLSEPSMEEICIEIQDSGPGIPEHLHASLFEPFVTSRNEGTGLGLAIVKQIVRQHGGSIQLLGSAEGACFRINLLRNGPRQ